MELCKNKKMFTSIVTLAFLVCLLNQDIFSRGYIPPPKTDSGFMNSNSWPQDIKDYLRLELIYGDHKIDEREVKYLVNTSFKSQKKESLESIDNIIEPISILLTAFPIDDKVIEACVSQILSVSELDSEKVKNTLDEKLGKNRESLNSAKSTCEKIISMNGNVSLSKDNSSDWLLFQLLKTKGITPTIFTRFVTENQIDIYRALQPLKFMKGPDEYIISLADYVIKESKQLETKIQTDKLTMTEGWKLKADNTESKIMLAELASYINDSNRKKLIDILLSTIPSVIKNGEISYRIGSVGPDSQLFDAIQDSLMLPNFKSEYLKAKNAGNLLSFFTTTTPSNEQRVDISWLLYRYHSEFIRPIFEMYVSDSLPKNSNKSAVKTVLINVSRYGEIFKEYTPYIPDSNSLK